MHQRVSTGPLQWSICKPVTPTSYPQRSSAPLVTYSDVFCATFRKIRASLLAFWSGQALISKGPGTHSPERGHGVIMNITEGQRCSQCCQHCYILTPTELRTSPWDFWHFHRRTQLISTCKQASRNDEKTTEVRPPPLPDMQISGVFP